MDVTAYLNTYGLTAKELASRMILDIQRTVGITAAGGVGTNLYLAKVAMDIGAKHAQPDEHGVRIAELDEMSYRRTLWTHRPSPISGGWGRAPPKSWNSTALSPWGTWPGALWASRASC